MNAFIGYGVKRLRQNKSARFINGMDKKNDNKKIIGIKFKKGIFYKE
jgi:hypothetical protein